MTERATGWVLNDPDTGKPCNPANAMAAEGRAFTKVNAAAFDAPAPAVAVLEPPAPPMSKTTRSAKKAAPAPASSGETTELDMDDEGAVLEAISKLAAVSHEPVYAAALQTIREAELSRAVPRPSIATALDGAMP